MISDFVTRMVSNFAAASCSGGGFFSFPTWYKYLPSIDGATHCTPQITNISDVWLILAAVIEILLRIAALGAIVFVVWGGVMYITSQGQPDKTQKARETIVNALVGLGIAVAATAIISFVAGRF